MRTAAFVWAALLVLLALTCGSAFVPMGAWNTVANFSIALVKALLIALFFMHLARGSGAHRLSAIAAVYTLCLLLGLSYADYATRIRYAAPWQAPIGVR